MDITTMTMNAATCVLSVRPRAAGQIRLADSTFEAQGTTVSVAAVMGGRVADFRAPITGDVSVLGLTSAPAYKTIDVVRSRSGRPPV
ncbi:MAG: hypothetical protein HOQ18_11830 [Dermatophilaceae bacterium]|nr:hypothetical protein [Dermatophilaceae bacterium]NUR81516.1 hypothetical protein [Dermatophilaceae bacterium]